MVRVLFVHPDLGIGGAERLVVDAAVALQQKGHTVTFLTNHHDPSHCFEETRNGSLPVITVGDWLPRTIFGKFAALCAYVRMVYAALYMVTVLSKKSQIDVIFCDQISLGIPIFRLAAQSPKILFYCHFPDQLQSQPGTALKDLYRVVLNYLEEKTTGSADGILVNSKFTRRIFKQTFSTLKTTPAVLYPSLNTEYFDKLTEIDVNEFPLVFDTNAIVFLSVNRYDRKKNLPLAITSFKLLQSRLTKKEFDRCILVLAGGYDIRVDENVEHFQELVQMAEELQFSKKVFFLKSPGDEYKKYLLQKCVALLYTPENEHFGIVPLEGMYLRKPVIAMNSGGPTETVIHESTGFLCDNKDDSVATAMAKFVKDQTLSGRMGEMGRKRVQQKFSFDAFTDQLDTILKELIANKPN